MGSQEPKVDNFCLAFLSYLISPHISQEKVVPAFRLYGHGFLGRLAILLFTHKMCGVLELRLVE